MLHGFIHESKQAYAPKLLRPLESLVFVGYSRNTFETHGMTNTTRFEKMKVPMHLGACRVLWLQMAYFNDIPASPALSNGQQVPFLALLVAAVWAITVLTEMVGTRVFYDSSCIDSRWHVWGKRFHGKESHRYNVQNVIYVFLQFALKKNIGFMQKVWG